MWLVAAVAFIIWGCYSKSVNNLYLGLFWIMCSLIQFLKSGFCELIEKGYKQY